MRIAALILGILGGLFGFVGSFFALTLGGVGAAVGADGANTVVGGGVGALVFSLLGLIAGCLALAFPRFAGWTMTICAIGGLISVSLGYALAGPMLLVGGILALVSARKPKGVQQAA